MRKKQNNFGKNLYDRCNVFNQKYKLKKINDISFESINDRHKGQRCFILGTGPTLNDIDVSKIKNDVTIGLNSIVNLHIPNYWVALSNGAFIPETNIPLIFKSEIVFFNESCFDVLDKYSKKINYSYDKSKTFTYFAGREFEYPFLQRINSDIVPMMNGASVLFPAIQIAFIMGFSEVCLLGICFKNFSRNYYAKSEKKKPLCGFYVANGIKAMKETKEMFDLNNRKLFSGTSNNLFVDEKILEYVNYKDLF